MKNFGNFMVKQMIETKKVLIETFSENFEDPDYKVEQLVKYKNYLNDLNYQELMNHAKKFGIKIPCPGNY